MWRRCSNPDLAVQGAANDRRLRRRGVTVRKPIDLIIGTFCIVKGHTLLTSDRDSCRWPSIWA
jgi:hypothetical protein